MQTITLKHSWTGEVKTFPVVAATPSHILFLRWPMTQPYAFHVLKNMLFRSERSKMPLLWQAENPQAAFKLWQSIINKEPLQ